MYIYVYTHTQTHKEEIQVYIDAQMYSTLTMLSQNRILYMYMYAYMQAMTLLNHAGVCMSYTATWNHLRALTQQANLLTKVQSGHWIWAYDNLNIHRPCRHERQGD